MVIFIVVIMLIIVALIMAYVDWSTHLDMTISESKHFKYGNYSKFIQQFESYTKWIPDYNHKSFFGLGTEHSSFYIHASIFKFNDKGMLLRPISYFKVKWYINSQLKKYKQIEDENNNKDVKFDW